MSRMYVCVQHMKYVMMGMMYTHFIDERILLDRTVKVWNLKTGTDLLTLDKHFSYVRCVRYCPRNSLIFTASQSLIKVCTSVESGSRSAECNQLKAQCSK